ncbi:tRNA intron endonuclease, partial [Fimicolochytrium jonesii]|uniref:tRNA intron endonuclease n=1 Tax=Fimicolochytrium jonesii TaxID=1396493 RepID=UPI0022FECED4
GVDATASIETAVDPALPLPLNPPLPITIPTSSQFLPWFSVKSSQSSTLDRELWTYPRTPQEERHCKVFCALWEKGFFITSGSKFGGDYLLYPGDILRFHAHFIVAVVPMKTLYSPLDAVMFGRLGTAVKKRFALCSWDDEKDELVSFSLEWTGW